MTGESSLPGVNVLLEGDAGSGKTRSIGTLIDAAKRHGIEVFYLALEPGMETLIGYYKDKGEKVPDNFHYMRVEQSKVDFATLMKASEKIMQSSDFEALSKVRDPDKAKYNAFYNILSACNQFTDQHGETFSPVCDWNPDRALVIDPMTGINTAAMAMTIGGKPIRTQTDWGVAQGRVETLLRLLTDGSNCHFILTAHVEKELDPVLGGMKLTISTLGKALAPLIPAMFSDVIYAYRDGPGWYWSTSNTQAILKTRNLPYKDKMPPDFGPILDSWKRRAFE